MIKEGNSSETADNSSPDLQITVDVGGTFTDLIMADGLGGMWFAKLPSTPPEFEKGIIAGIERLLHHAKVEPNLVTRIAHGTTVATNAVLEHRGARTALITTHGFRDVLELRRVRAPQIYDLFFEKPPTLIERALRFELTERLAANGDEITAIHEDELPQIRDRLLEEDVESVAVCLLHSYAFPQHEQRVGEYLRRELPDLPVSLSCEVLRERREYERTATTAVNAYVQPVMQHYLDRLQEGLQKTGIEAPLLIMQSTGGLTPVDEAARRPVFILESGPAGGVLGAWNISKNCGMPNFFSFDMGGTTAKASLIENGEIQYSNEYEVGGATSAGNRLVSGGGEMILAPTIDIAEVGTGGGSVAFLDTAGGLQVGPRSAGAVPGPVCYGRGGNEPTVTDANVVLGYIPSGKLGAGDIVVDDQAARDAIASQIAKPLGMDVLDAALGIHQIANAHMLRALREVSIQKGRDPRDFSMVAFGGAGPVHAAGLAREMGVRKLLIPPMPGLFSSIGMLISGVKRYDVRSCLLSGDLLTADELRSQVNEMKTLMLKQFSRETHSRGQVVFESSIDLRYKGQFSQISVPWVDDTSDKNSLQELFEKFEHEHSRLYGRRDLTDSAVGATAVRLIGSIPFDQSYKLKPAPHPDDSQRTRMATFGEPWETMETPVIARSKLSKPTPGPLLIDEFDSTTVVPPDMTAQLDERNNIILEPCK